jgi:hypothetical protein
VTVKGTKVGKVVGDMPAATHLNAMLHGRALLDQFRPVDQVSRTPMYARASRNPSSE